MFGKDFGISSGGRVDMWPAWYYVDKGFVPWTHDWGIASAPRGDMKSLDLTEILIFLWFSHDFSKSARAGNLQNFW